MPNGWGERLRRPPRFQTVAADRTAYRDNRPAQIEAFSQMMPDISPRQLGSLLHMMDRNEQVAYGPKQIYYNEYGQPKGYVSGDRDRFTGDIWAADVPSFFHERHHRRQIQDNPLDLIRARMELMYYGIAPDGIPQVYYEPGTVEYEAERRMDQDTTRFNAGKFPAPMYDDEDMPEHLRRLLQRPR